MNASDTEYFYRIDKQNSIENILKPGMVLENVRLLNKVDDGSNMESILAKHIKNKGLLDYPLTHCLFKPDLFCHSDRRSSKSVKSKSSYLVHRSAPHG